MKWLAGVGVILLCGIACSLPFLLVGGAGIIGFSTGSWFFGGILLAAAVIAMVYMKIRNPAHEAGSSCSTDGSCGCSPKAQ